MKILCANGKHKDLEKRIGTIFYEKVCQLALSKWMEGFLMVILLQRSRKREREEETKYRNLSSFFVCTSGVNEEQLNYIIEPLNMYSRLMNTRYKHLYICIK